MNVAQREALHWQNTRCRIVNVTFRDPRGDNILTINHAFEDAWGIGKELFDSLLAGSVVSIALAMVRTDQSTVIGYSVGDGRSITLAGATGDLQRRILTDV